jgi:hypothetical protein
MPEIRQPPISLSTRPVEFPAISGQVGQLEGQPPVETTLDFLLLAAYVSLVNASVTTGYF